MTEFPFVYAVYGLTVASNRALDGFGPVTSGVPIVTVDFAGRPKAAPMEEQAPFWDSGFETLWHRADGSWLLRYVDSLDGAFWTIDYDGRGTRLIVRWTDDRLADDIPALLQGPGLAIALHLQGVPMLHASLLAVDDAGIAILGEPGAGKSTTAAALVACGHRFMSDDLVALDVDEASVVARPGSPRLRAFADSMAAAGFAAADLPPIFAEERLGPKRGLAVSAAEATFQPDPLPLRAVYHLEGRAPGRRSPTVEPVSPRLALPVLLQNLYATRFLDRGRRERVVRAVTAVAADVPLRAVRASDDLAALPELVAAIAADARRVSG